MSKEIVVPRWQQVGPEARAALATRFSEVIKKYSRNIEPVQDISGISSTALGFHILLPPGHYRLEHARLGDFPDAREFNIIEFRLGSFATSVGRRVHNTISIGHAEDLDHYERDPKGAKKLLLHGLGYKSLLGNAAAEGYFALEGRNNADRHLVSGEDMGDIENFLESVDLFENGLHIDEVRSPSLNYVHRLFPDLINRDK